MAKLYNTIYVANPHDREKLEVFKDIKTKILSADSKLPECKDCDEYEEKYRDDCPDDWDNIASKVNFHPCDALNIRIIDNIDDSDAVFLYVNAVCKNTVSVEMTYASITGKPCYIIINNNGTLDFDGIDMESGETILDPFAEVWDSIYLLMGLPNTYVYQCSSVISAKKTVKKILSLESPIEAMLLHEQPHINFNTDTLHFVEPQYVIGQYRVDFAFPDQKVVVEVDGHEYHKTKEQRTNDAKKDRFLMSNGWKVLRFTGSEIFKDAQKCHMEIKTHLR